MTQYVAVVIHDVAPATWPACQRLIDMADAIGKVPLTLLVVPHFHGGTAVADSPAFIEGLNTRRARGDELALHGYYHCDDAPAPRTLSEWVNRRVLTRREGEFAAIDPGDARKRLAAGLRLFEQLHWPVRGFVPPAWQLNRPTRAALDTCGHALDYVGVRSGLYRLPHWQLERTANYVYSPDRWWRRGMSRAVLRAEQLRARNAPLLRLSIHPADAAVPSVLAHWKEMISEACMRRVPVTKAAYMLGHTRFDTVTAKASIGPSRHPENTTM